MFKNKATGSIMTPEEMLDEVHEFYHENRINAYFEDWVIRTIKEDYEEVIND